MIKNALITLVAFALGLGSTLCIGNCLLASAGTEKTAAMELVGVLLSSLATHGASWEAAEATVDCETTIDRRIERGRSLPKSVLRFGQPYYVVRITLKYSHNNEEIRGIIYEQFDHREEAEAFAEPYVVGHGVTIYHPRRCINKEHCLVYLSPPHVSKSSTGGWYLLALLHGFSLWIVIAGRHWYVDRNEVLRRAVNGACVGTVVGVLWVAPALSKLSMLVVLLACAHRFLDLRG